MSESLVVKNKVLLNPFYMLAAVWTGVFLLYALNLSNLFVRLSWQVVLFFCVLTVFAFVAGKTNKTNGYIVKSHMKPLAAMIFIVGGYIAEFLYMGYIPLFSGNEYVEFVGIKVLHVVLVTFSGYYTALLASTYLSDKKGKYLLCVVVIIVFNLLLFNRAALTMQVITLTIIFFSRINLKKHLVLFFLTAAAVLYLFGAFGNLRSGYGFFDSTLICEVGQISNSYPQFLPKEYFWSYIYVTSPLANLQYTVSNYSAVFNLNDWFFYNLPDFVASRLSLNKYNRLLITPILNVSTAFEYQYLTAGFAGMYIYLALVFTINIVFIKLFSKTRHNAAVLSILCCINILTFFDNTLKYSGISLQLVYPLIYLAIDKHRLRA